MKIIKWVSIAVLLMLVALAGVYYWYTANPYQPLAAMESQIDQLDNIERSQGDQFIRYHPVVVERANLVFVPGALVAGEAYEYVAAALAEQGIGVTIVKPPRNLAIMSPSQPQTYLRSDATNFIAGHSLGGTVAAMNGRQGSAFDSVILLASYATTPVSVPVLSIVGSEDSVLDQTRYRSAKVNYLSGFEEITIAGGNHAQFGWYGPQEGDSPAQLSVQAQQDYVVDAILDFIDQRLAGQ